MDGIVDDVNEIVDDGSEIVDEVGDLGELCSVFVAQGERHSPGQDKNKEVLNMFLCCLSQAFGGLPHHRPPNHK